MAGTFQRFSKDWSHRDISLKFRLKTVKGQLQKSEKRVRETFTWSAEISSLRNFFKKSHSSFSTRFMIITWLTDDAHFGRLESFHFKKVNVPDSG